jgi:hypothetical protein
MLVVEQQIMGYMMMLCASQQRLQGDGVWYSVV